MSKEDEDEEEEEKKEVFKETLYKFKRAVKKAKKHGNDEDDGYVAARKFTNIIMAVQKQKAAQLAKKDAIINDLKKENEIHRHASGVDDQIIDQMHKLSDELRHKELQIQEFKRKSTVMQEQSEIEMRNKSEFGVQVCNEVPDEAIKETKRRHKHQRKSMKTEIKRLKSQIFEKEKEVNREKEEIERLKHKIAHKDKRKISRKRKHQQMSMEIEVEKLKFEVNAEKKEIQRLKNKMADKKKRKKTTKKVEKEVVYVI